MPLEMQEQGSVSNEGTNETKKQNPTCTFWIATISMALQRYSTKLEDVTGSVYMALLNIPLDTPKSEYQNRVCSFVNASLKKQLSPKTKVKVPVSHLFEVPEQ